jgi:hypothetical protein
MIYHLRGPIIRKPKMTIEQITELLDVMTPDQEALQEVIKVHEQLDPVSEPLILSMSLFGDSIWGTECIG